ncbi:ABC transporter ATP-binding protein [Metabacillus malikii]|uniref:ABC-2 type transport system ATP-binding protein n=1 Tax=Metabacillus malikii TaxID=1504265 RepID=A0ABT9ZD84_9BACI|nr:ABC transporter ATP-binding protein [Metabacillus malikii]MDQ0229894.1 ABC-2 type transport system ATP-binding protein [Metabacillus malikii]
MANHAMQINNIHKNIGRKEIIKGLSFTINKGEVFGFLGPNGAGKTTTIRMMVGLISITKGDILIEGKSIKTNFKEAIRHVGAIVENPEMYPYMSGWKNLLHYARMIDGISKDRINEVIKLVGLEKAIHEKVGRYSLGMRQRLGIAQALLHNPSILILDEPTNGLDPSGIREIRQYIRNLAEKEQVAVIVSSHLLSEMEMMCDRIGVINNGRIIAIESVQDTLQQSKVNQALLKATPIEVAKVMVEEMLQTSVTTRNDTLMFATIEDEIPTLIKNLVNEEIQIYGIQLERTTLEDKFIHLIGEANQ